MSTQNGTTEAQNSGSPTSATATATAPTAEQTTETTKPTEGTDGTQTTEAPKKTTSLLGDNEAETTNGEEGEGADSSSAFERTELDGKTLETLVGEGQTLDPELSTKFIDAFNGAKTTEELAANMLNLYNDTATRAAESQAADWERFNTEMTDAVKADPIYGGANLEQSIATSKQVVEKYGGTPAQVKELKSMLDTTGAGNSLALIRLLNRAAGDLTGLEPTSVTTQTQPAGLSLADKLFGDNT